MKITDEQKAQWARAAARTERERADRDDETRLAELIWVARARSVGIADPIPLSKARGYTRGRYARFAEELRRLLDEERADEVARLREEAEAAEVEGLRAEQDMDRQALDRAAADRDAARAEAKRLRAEYVREIEAERDRLTEQVRVLAGLIRRTGAEVRCSGHPDHPDPGCGTCRDAEIIHLGRGAEQVRALLDLDDQ